MEASILMSVYTKNQDLKNFIHQYLFDTCKITTSGNGIGDVVIDEFEDNTFNTALSNMVEKIGNHSLFKKRLDLVGEVISKWSQGVNE